MRSGCCSDFPGAKWAMIGQLRALAAGEAPIQAASRGADQCYWQLFRSARDSARDSARNSARDSVEEPSATHPGAQSSDWRVVRSLCECSHQALRDGSGGSPGQGVAGPRHCSRAWQRPRAAGGVAAGLGGQHDSSDVCNWKCSWRRRGVSAGPPATGPHQLRCLHCHPLHLGLFTSWRLLSRHPYSSKHPRVSQQTGPQPLAFTLQTTLPLQALTQTSTSTSPAHLYDHEHRGEPTGAAAHWPVGWLIRWAKHLLADFAMYFVTPIQFAMEAAAASDASSL